MRNHREHPSFLELDRYWLHRQAGADAHPGAHIVRHVESCAVCRDYLCELDRHQHGPVPAWVRSLQPATKPWRWRWRPALAIAALAGALAAAAFVLQPGDGDRGQARTRAYVAAKSAPSMGLYVKRQHRVFLWNGSAPFYRGDHIMLKVIPEGYTYLTVFAPTTDASANTGVTSDAGDGARHRLVALYQGEVAPAGATTLPEAWRLDGASARETLIVVLSHGPVSADAVVGQRDAVSQQSSEDPAALWLREVILPVRNSREASP